MPLANPWKRMYARERRKPTSTGVPRARRALAAVLLATAGAGFGCQSTLTGPLALIRNARDRSLSPGLTDKEVGDDRNIFARLIKPKAPPAGDFDGNPLVLGSDGWKPMIAPKDPEADKELAAAQALYQQGKLDEAEKAYKVIAKKRKGSPWGEKAQFYLAESQFQRGHYFRAHDNYELLIKDYKGTEFNQKLVEREYIIAQVWLAQYDPKAPPETKIPWYGGFDGRRPYFDVHGHAISALEHVRHNNVNGPLADDAVLRIADEHMKAGEYELAGIFYDQLITDHPKSAHLQRAQLASIDARMKAYVGPEYDGAGLEKAREMIKQTLASFPDRPAGNEPLFHTLDIINDQEAERAYVVASYYKKTGKVASAEYYYGKIPQKWPKSPWAAKAKVELATLAKKPRKLSDPSKIMTQPGANDSFFSGGGPGMGGMGGSGMGGGGMGGMGGGMGGGGMM
jgi:outer membrane protein assembly factor BamD (BamD/ComL family)